MSVDQEPERTKSKTAALIASIVGAVAILAAFLTNIEKIAEFFEPMFGHHDVAKTTLSPQPLPSPLPHKVARVCMGNSGGDNCLSGSNAHFDCNAYRGYGGGSQKTTDTLADSFCGYSQNGVHKVYPNNIIVLPEQWWRPVRLDGL
jgi:hypothetical protein